ncbi:MAG: sugar ABC transporter ATP-binding protein, partial [Ilumatobacter fluminis]
LILDEPTSALTPNESERLYDVVHRLQEQGTTIVWISHRMEEVRALADTMTVLRDGTHVRTAPSDDLDDDELIRLMVGRSVTIERVERTQEPGDVCLEVRDLSVPGKFADVDFEIREGEIVTLAGLVGAGRSEIAQAIFGLDPLVTGTVFVEGEPVKPTSPRVMSDHGVAYLPEDRDAEGVITTLPIADNIALPSTVDLAWHGVMRRDQELELADEQRAALSIKGENDDPVNSLSGGNRQKVALARWLATKPKVLMLDEPTHGIDVGTKAQVHRIMRELAREERLGILMISSDMPEVLAVSDRILVIARGRLVAELDAGTATQEQVLAAATNTQAVAS